jgi:hypothetical protein
MEGDGRGLILSAIPMVVELSGTASLVPSQVAVFCKT